MAAATRGDHVGAARNFVKAYGPEGRSVTGYGLGGRKVSAGAKAGSRNNNSTIKKARLRFFVFLNKKETTQVACFNSHKNVKEPHPAFLHCGIVEAL